MVYSISSAYCLDLYQCTIFDSLKIPTNAPACLYNPHHLVSRMEDLDHRVLAIKKLQMVRQMGVEDREPCEVLPGLFIGPIGAARNLDSLQKSGITHVLNASPVIPCFHRRHLRYKKVIVYDDPDDDISRYFDESNRFIQKARKKGGVLVHCFAGQSRSAALVAAYLIACEGLAAPAALDLIRKTRPSAQPNTGFLRQLRSYSQVLDGTTRCERLDESTGATM